MGREWERAGQYHAQGFLSPSSKLFAWPKLQRPESGTGVCLAALISGSFQLPNTVPHHHPQCTCGTQIPPTEPESGEGEVGSEFTDRLPTGTRPEAFPFLPPQRALLFRLASEWAVLTAEGASYVLFNPPNLPARLTHCSSHVSKRRQNPSL